MTTTTTSVTTYIYINTVYIHTLKNIPADAASVAAAACFENMFLIEISLHVFQSLIYLLKVLCS